MEINQQRVLHLVQYIKGIKNKENSRELYQKYRDEIEHVNPMEVFHIFYQLLDEGLTPKEILVFLDKIITAFYKSLTSFSQETPQQIPFLTHLKLENQALIGKLTSIKEMIKEKQLSLYRKQLIDKITELQSFQAHYLKKENILFPMMEKKATPFHGLTIMWALHDEVKATIKKVMVALEEEVPEEEFNRLIGDLFFGMLGLVQKEELILFPCALQLFEISEWQAMEEESKEYDFPFIERPNFQTSTKLENNDFFLNDKEYLFKSETGELTFQQLIHLFNALPVDLTFVDENNLVKFFTRPKERIFPRSPSVIGRDVRRCHPPKSIDIVEKIIEAFKTGKEDSATFWIDLHGKKILIQYFALRDRDGTFRGTLEVSQDITDIQRLKGESRLLDWGKDPV